MATKEQTVVPLIDIHGTEFEKEYRLGLWWRMYGWQVHGEEQAQGILSESYLVDNLKTCAGHGYFDGQHDHWLSHIGFYLGMIHGGVLSPSTGELRPNAITLVTFQHQEGARGYMVGREWLFHEAMPNEMRSTDSCLIEQFRHIVKDSFHFEDVEATWYYSIGCLLGEISGQLFPETQQERLEWEKGCCIVAVQMLHTESLHPVVAKEA